ncbi:MAG TPA: Gfo/Idh/MocA family oxidoreductase [Catenuloplanes sp.]
MALRFGLFGTGYWAAETHGAVLATHPSAELVGVWGRDPAKAQALAGRYGTRAYHDVDALIDEADAVAVALPPDVQADVAARAADAGRHLLLDKPLAFNTVAADRVVAAVAARGSASVVFFTARFRPATEKFLAATAAQAGWHGARAVRFSANFTPGSPYAGSAWRRERGGLWDVGPHVLSVLLPVLGPVAEVVAMAGPRGTTHVLLRHTGGAVSTLGLSVDAAPAAVASHVVFFGEPGTVEVPNDDCTAREAFGGAVDQLALAAAGGPPPVCDVRFGREVVAVLAAAEQAHRLGRSVPVTRA